MNQFFATRRLAVATTLVLALASGSCAILGKLPVGATTSSTVLQWGKPVASGGPGPLPTAVQTLGASQIDAGNNSDLAVLANGTVWAWGNTEVAGKSMLAVQIPGLVHVVQDPVDGNHDFAALEQPGTDAACPASSTVMTWGLNQAGDLGLGIKSGTYATPQVVTALNCQNVVMLAAAAEHMVALTSSGRIYVWGSNGSDVLGLAGTVKHEYAPTLNPAATALAGGSAAEVEVTAGSSTGGMLVRDRAYSWGNNVQGECGCGSTAPTIVTPTAVSQGTNLFTWIDQGGNIGTNGHELALTAAGAVWAWGDGAQGQLGSGGVSNSSVPVLVTGLPLVATVRAGGLHSLALDRTGNVWAWGGNSFGEVGDGTHTDALRPVKVLSGVHLISAGSLHSIAE